MDLKTGELKRTIDTFSGSVIPKAFAGSMINSTADFDLDYSDDVLYIGYVKQNGVSGPWNRGGVLRLQTKGSLDPNDWVASKVIDDIGPVTSSVVRLQNNNSFPPMNWLFFGTGRYYHALLNDPDDPSDPRKAVRNKGAVLHRDRLRGETDDQPPVHRRGQRDDPEPNDAFRHPHGRPELVHQS